jgi:hypothetical protein
VTEILSLVREHEALLRWLAGLSLGMLLASLVAFPLVIINLPEDYFVRERRNPAYRTRRHPAVWLAVTIAKNLLGALLVTAGIAMLVLPGQGLLTILIGMSLLNFPGKYVLERRIVGRPGVGRVLNRIRSLAGRPELRLPPAPRHDGSP